MDDNQVRIEALEDHVQRLEREVELIREEVRALALFVGAQLRDEA